MDLVEPVILIGIRIIFSLVWVILAALGELLFEGNFKSILLIPFKLVGSFIATLFPLDETYGPSNLILVAFRVILAAYLLNMDKQKRDFCSGMLHKVNLSEIEL